MIIIHQNICKKKRKKQLTIRLTQGDENVTQDQHCIIKQRLIIE